MLWHLLVALLYLRSITYFMERWKQAFVRERNRRLRQRQASSGGLELCRPSQKRPVAIFVFCCAAYVFAGGQAAAPVGANDKGLTLASKTKRLGKTVVYLKGESRTARCVL